MNLKEEGKVSPEALMVMYLDEIAGRLADLSADFKSKEVAIQSVRIAPLSELIWDNKEIEPRTTAVIDTFGYFPVMYIELSEPRNMVLSLTEVSRDGKKWRRVDEIIKEFKTEESNYAYVNLNDVIKTKEVLAYRYYKIRMDAETAIKLTVEITSKHVGVREESTETMVSNVTNITDQILPTVAGELKQIMEYLSGIHEQLANAAGWEHGHTIVTSAGSPVSLGELEVPDGCQLVVKSMDTNTGAIYLGKSDTAVKNINKRVTLSRKNESTTFKVSNANLIWVDAGIDGEGVEYWSEEKK